MRANTNKVCSVDKADHLNSSLRHWLQNPSKILDQYINVGMTVLDFGCGPGFFSIDLAKMVGQTGRVIAVDLQDGMLEKLRKRIMNTRLENIIELQQCTADTIAVTKKVDFVLAFYVIHELRNQDRGIKQLCSVLKPEGLFYLAEPGLFHVSKEEFKNTVRKVMDQGLRPIANPGLLFSKVQIFRKNALA